VYYEYYSDLVRSQMANINIALYIDLVELYFVGSPPHELCVCGWTSVEGILHVYIYEVTNNNATLTWGRLFRVPRVLMQPPRGQERVRPIALLGLGKTSLRFAP